MMLSNLQAEMITALKKKDAFLLGALRYIVAQIKNRQIEKQKEMTDEEVVEVLRKIARQMCESIAAFEKGNRADLVEETHKQLAIVSRYLPPEISDEELDRAIRAIIETNKELYERTPKAAIGICVRELKSKAETGRILKMLSKLR